MQQEFYDATADIMAIDNHRGHDSNPDYSGILLGDIIGSPGSWAGKSALDFGCGIGRNVDNLLKLASWSNVDGCDISSENIIRANKFLETTHPKDNFNLYTTTGVDLQPIESDQYDFVMSTIVFQHIAVRDIRLSLMKDIFRVMKSGGLFSFQMAQYDRDHIGSAGYFDNTWDAPGTNGRYDVSVENVSDLLNDLLNIGFKGMEYDITPEWDANSQTYVSDPHSRWVWVKAWKP
jgi:SAM-dependent methyltransferase